MLYLYSAVIFQTCIVHLFGMHYDQGITGYKYWYVIDWTLRLLLPCIEDIHDKLNVFLD